MPNKKEDNQNSNNVVLAIIKQRLPNMTQSLQRVAKYILNEPGKAVEKTAAQIAKESLTSDASVIRLCKEIGFKGYHDFKIQLAKELGAEHDYQITENIVLDDSPWSVFNKILAQETKTLNLTKHLIKKEVFTQVVNKLIQANRIGFFSVGSSYAISYFAYFQFSKLGISSQAEQDPGAQLILANSLKKGDVAFAISRTGQSKIPISALEIAKNNGVNTICLTQNPRSEIVKFSDYSLIPAENIDEPMEETLLYSRIVNLTVISALLSAASVLNWEVATNHSKNISKIIRTHQF